jgi:hypothetical protein
MNENILDALVAAVAERVALKDVGHSETGTRGHGVGGVFSVFNMNQNVMNAAVMPLSSLLTRLPFRSSTFTQEKYGILTGFRPGSGPGTASTDECGDCETAGLVKLCTVSVPFGRFCMDTPIYDVTRFGERTGRSEFMDYRVIGNPMADLPIGSPAAPANTSDMLNNDIAKFLAEFTVGYQRSFARKLIYTGNPANSAGNNNVIEPRGLDILINTGYQDSDTAVACPAADSLVRSFGSLDVATNGAAIVNEITYMYRYFKQLARGANLMPVKWALVMAPALFYELSAVWPCAYLSNRCNAVGNNVNNIDARDQADFRAGMRNDSYLLIDDEQVEVIQDDLVAETYAAGEYTSQIYFVPLTVMGNMPVTFGEYFDFNAPGGAAEAASLLGQVGDFKVVAGRYFWTRERNGTCFKWKVIERPRLVLQTPYLAGRLTDVKYVPLIHPRSWSPSDDWFYNGGNYTGQSHYIYPPSIYESANIR